MGELREVATSKVRYCLDFGLVLDEAGADVALRQHLNKPVNSYYCTLSANSKHYIS